MAEDQTILERSENFAWKDIFNESKSFSLKTKIEGRSQYEWHFEYAGKLNSGEKISADLLRTYARETIENYLIRDSKAENINETSY